MDLGAHTLQLPSAEVLVQKVGRRLQLRRRKVVLDGQQTVAHRAAAAHDDGQHPPLRQPCKVHMLQQIARRQRADRQAHAARKRGQHAGTARQQGFRAGHTGQAAINRRLHAGSQPHALAASTAKGTSHAAQLLHVHTKCLRRRNSTGRGVRLFQQARLGQLSHLIAHRRRTHRRAMLGQRTGQRRRTHRFAAGDICFHRHPQNLLLPCCEPTFVHRYVQTSCWERLADLQHVLILRRGLLRARYHFLGQLQELPAARRLVAGQRRRQATIATLAHHRIHVHCPQKR